MADPEAPPRELVLFPAIDLRRGRCVRLEKGDADRETAYGDDPAVVAERYAAAGAEWVHIVDLDAAFGDGSNRARIREIAGASPLRVQSGGGLRTVRDLEDVLDGGVARAVIGTAAIENPDLVREAIQRWGPDRIAVGLDARGLRPATRGWREESPVGLMELGCALTALGVRTLIHTDIDRDGTFAGPNLALSAQLAERTGAQVIVSGGMRGVEDVEAVRDAALAGAALGGAIVGKALYEGRLNLAEALLALGR